MRSRLVGPALLLLGSILVSLAAGELIVRYLRPDTLPGPDQVRGLFWQSEGAFWQYDPEVGWGHRPGVDDVITSDEFSHRVRINSAGWRDRERAVEKQPGIFRIAVLGDSFTFGAGIEDDQLYTAQLEALLKGVEVLNFGLSGTATDQQLLILRRDVLEYRPDMVLVMLCRNDFDGILTDTQFFYPKPFFELGEGGELMLRNVPVPRVSRATRLRHWLRGRSGLFSMIDSVMAPRARGEGPNTDEKIMSSEKLMRRLLLAMRDESEAAGAGFALALVASTGHVYTAGIDSLESRRREMLRSLAEKEGFLFIDLIPEFRNAAREASPGSWRRLHFQKDQHWNLAGHALAARILADSLLREKGLPAAAHGGPS